MIKQYLLKTVKNPTIVFPKDHILLLSHMRSYSSLLAHILGSHPDISGYYEHHTGYYSWRSLIRSRLNFHIDNPEEKTTKIYFDKVLHNGIKVDEKILKNQRVREIFMLRNPIDSIKSIMTLHGRWDPDHRYGNPIGASKYYIDRLVMLQSLLLQIDTEKKPLYIDAEAVTENTENSLKLLSEKLHIHPELSPDYRVFKDTGKQGKGDVSSTLKEGKISKSQKKRNQKDIEIPDDVYRDAYKAYENTRSLMLERCDEPITKKAEQ